MSDTDARLWHPWLRIDRVLRVRLHTRWSAEAWAQVRGEFTKQTLPRGDAVEQTRAVPLVGGDGADLRRLRY
jgi:hypothetical protein